jgi:hypothetical protein
MISSGSKFADKNVLERIQNKLPAFLKDIQFGMGCSFELEKLVNFVRFGHELQPGHDCAKSDYTDSFFYYFSRKNNQ